MHTIQNKLVSGTGIYFRVLIDLFTSDLLRIVFLSSSEKRLLQELEAAREARRAIERQREELVKKAKLMQNKTQNRRNHGRWL